MSEWKFILIKRDGTRVEIPQPLNWDAPIVEVARDVDNGWHGVFFDYGLDKLQFDGLGFTLIKEEYEAYGVNGEMHMDIMFRCAEDNVYDVFYEHGRLAFDEYSDTCGDECTCSIGIQDSSDIMLFKNNYEQKVNVNSGTAFDQSTALTPYNKLNFDLDIPPRGLVNRSEAVSSEEIELDFFSLFQADWQHMANNGTGTEEGSFPVLFVDQGDVIINEVNDETVFQSYPQYYHDADPGDMLETTLIPGNVGSAIACKPGTFRVVVSVAGNVNYEAFGDHTFRLRMTIMKGPDAGNTDLVAQQYGVDGQFNGDQSHDFSMSIDTLADLQPGDKLWIYYYITFVKNGLTGSEHLFGLWLTQDEGARIFLEQTLVCEPSKAKVSLVNETASRIVEAITNDQIRFYSTFFGRKDSQPYAINTDPCFGFMALTNGLNIRRKLLKDNTQPGFFMTMKQLFEGLNPVCNIGLTIEPDPNRTGYKRLRLEDWRFFYQPDVAMRFPYATKITREIDINRLFNRVIVGYNKWEAGGTTGLDELMTKRTYRLNLNAISKELNICTDLICSPYTIEITRKQDTTTEDWQYDNDVFAFCLKKDGSTYSVETFLDSAASVTNVLDANTAYNGRITPLRNLMRWFNFIMQGYRVLQPDSKLIFSSGEGNYVATLELKTCNIEGKVIAENEDIDLTDFEELDDARPITFPELVSFDHPMNYNVFKRIKDDPTIRYKAISWTCNEVETEGWIDSISYRPMEGMASIVAIPKNNIIVSIPHPSCAATVTNLQFTPAGDGKMTISWEIGVPGATFYQLTITKNGEPYSTLNHSALSITLAALQPGTYNVIVLPFCDVDLPGANYVEGNFTIAAPSFALTLSAVLTNRSSNNRLQLTATGSVSSPYGFSFKFGECVLNTSSGITYCVGYPGSLIPTPTAIMNFNTGDTIKMVEGGQATAGASFGSITKVVLYDLVGITPAQITKAVGQTWTLEFM